MGLGKGARVKEEHALMPWFLTWVTEGMLVLYTEGDGRAGLTEAGRDEELSFRYVEWEWSVGRPCDVSQATTFIG